MGEYERENKTGIKSNKKRLVLNEMNHHLPQMAEES